MPSFQVTVIVLNPWVFVSTCESAWNCDLSKQPLIFSVTFHALRIYSKTLPYSYV